MSLHTGTLDSSPSLPAPDRVVWVLTKGDRRAELAARIHPVGVELRVSVGGSLILTEAVRPYDGKDARVLSEQHREAFVAHGWAVATITEG